MIWCWIRVQKALCTRNANCTYASRVLICREVFQSSVQQQNRNLKTIQTLKQLRPRKPTRSDANGPPKTVLNVATLIELQLQRQLLINTTTNSQNFTRRNTPNISPPHQSQDSTDAPAPSPALPPTDPLPLPNELLVLSNIFSVASVLAWTAAALAWLVCDVGTMDFTNWSNHCSFKAIIDWSQAFIFPKVLTHFNLWSSRTNAPFACVVFVATTTRCEISWCFARTWFSVQFNSAFKFDS